jgi:hypothetical protein
MSDQPLMSTQFPYLPLRFHIQGHTMTAVALLDTGFDGDVALPPTPPPADNAPDLRLDRALAGGKTARAAAYSGAARPGNFGPFDVTISALGGEPVVGRGIGDRFAVTPDHGRRAVVAP